MGDEFMAAANAIVLDDSPVYYPREFVETSTKKETCELHVVDSNGFMAMRGQGREFNVAHALRRHCQKTFMTHMDQFPLKNPLENAKDFAKIGKSVVKDIFEKAGVNQTLDEHESDKRQYLYTLEQLENSKTHDDLWNAAQTQLRRDGIIHNYLRMLWGKK